MKKLNKKQIIILIVCTIISLLIRFIFRNAQTGDYKMYIYPWIKEITRLGYFKSLKYNIGNYNVPYMIILTFIALIKYKPLYLVKLVSIIFDYICAIFGFKIVKKITKDNTKSLLTYISIIFLPTVIVNSSLWGQCDSIYTAFTLISLYYLLEKKYLLSFITLGISFSFKLQFIFILPLYAILLFKDKKIKIYHFFLIPLMNIILCMPAILMGRNIKDVLMIYFDQANEYHWLSMNFPNLYLYFDDMNINLNIIGKIGIILTFFIFLSMLLYVLIKKVKIDNKKILLIGLWSIVISTYFLPHMHERYMYVAEILSVIYFMSYFESFCIPVVINLVSVISYFYVIFDIEIITLKNLSILYFIFVIIFSIYTYKIVGLKHEKRKS